MELEAQDLVVCFSFSQKITCKYLIHFEVLNLRNPADVAAKSS